MKTQVFTLIAAAALIVAAGCSKDENTAADNGTPVVARITAAMAGEATATPTGKAGQPATRAVNDRWNRDHIGVLVYESPASDMAVRYRNAHYVTTSTGTTAEFTPADAANTIYFADADETVEFWAYAPYQPSASPGELPGTDGVITIDATRQATPEEQEAIDFIMAVEATASKSSPTVAFTRVDNANHSFYHIMSRIVLKIETPAAYGFAPADVERISRISLEGLCTGGAFDIKIDLAAGRVLGFGTDKSTWTADWDISGCVHTVGPDKSGAMQRIHTLIIPPHQRVKDKNGNTLRALPIAITLDGQVYRNDKDITGDANVNGYFSPGTSYEYTVRLKKSGIEVTGATISDWADGGKGSGDAVQL